MRIAVFGATGGTGREVVSQALEAGHDAAALVRREGVSRRTPACTSSLVTCAATRPPAAMERQGVRRLVVVSAHGAAESHDRSPYVLVVWTAMRHKMRDKEAVEALTRASDVDWTLVRPPALTSGPRTGRYRTGTDLRIGLTSRISRADPADFLLREAAEGSWVGRAPRIAA